MIQVQLKLRLRPAQERQLNRWLWHLTGVWNWAVKKIDADKAAGIRYSAYDFMRLVNRHGPRLGISQMAIASTAAAAHMAWRRCYEGASRRPKLKGRRNRLNSIPFGHGREFRPRGRTVAIPGLGRVRFHEMGIPEGHIGFARLIRRASGWYACLSIQAEPNAVPHVADGEVGIDPGFSHLLTLSTGEVVDHPRELEVGATREAQAQRGNRKRLIARLRERQANRRKDRNHKIARRVVAENAVIAFSADRHSAIARRFGKSVTSSSHYQLRQMLAYKSRAGGRRYIEVASRNSTRTCSSCLARTGPAGFAGLSVRVWTCACGATHHRDVNAAMNTLRLGLGTSHERGREAAPGIAT